MILYHRPKKEASLLFTMKIDSLNYEKKMNSIKKKLLIRKKLVVLTKFRVERKRVGT